MNESSQLHNTKIRFEDPEEEETTQCTNNLDESMCDPDVSDKAIDESLCVPDDVSFVDGDDKTSADYYFDSYYHFGKIPFFPFKRYEKFESLITVWFNDF
uniref:Uncharacterized protein n=1 Tax=Fagus sylvatica TaxID=28930 RepID=A0A2N9GCT2_FAGSY